MRFNFKQFHNHSQFKSNYDNLLLVLMYDNKKTKLIMS